jgi:hypothetical protein
MLHWFSHVIFMPISSITSSKSYSQYHQFMHQTMYHNMPQACSQESMIYVNQFTKDIPQTMYQDIPKACSKKSMICFKSCTIDINICVNHVPKYALSMFQTIQDIPQSIFHNLKKMPQAYTKVSKIFTSKNIENHTFYHVKNLVHEISDQKNFLGFGINKISSHSNFSSVLLDLIGKLVEPHVTSIVQPVGLVGCTIPVTWGYDQLGLP